MSQTQPERELVITGDIIPCTFQNPIVGHGVIQRTVDGEQCLIAAVTGNVERVNKVITVRPHLVRYLPEIGDVVVGRITAIADKKWRVDVNGRTSAGLQISGINLPGGQRKRTDEDALQMRLILKENELISAEVQRVLPDKSATLHTRSSRYGKLGYGFLVPVSAGLVIRQKQHFHTLDDLNIDLILGVNGYIWVQPKITDLERQDKQRMMDDSTLLTKTDGSSMVNYDEQSYLHQYKPYDQEKLSQETLESMARIRNAIRLLDITYTPITIDTILSVYNQSVEKALLPHEMINADYIQILTQYLKNSY